MQPQPARTSKPRPSQCASPSSTSIQQRLFRGPLECINLCPFTTEDCKTRRGRSAIFGAWFPLAPWRKMMRNAVRCTEQRRVRARIPWPRGSLVTLAFYWALSGCATLPAGEQTEPDDPLEPLNRAVFDANTALDDAFIRPLAEAYRAVVPPFVRDRIRSVLDNLAEPRIFANDLLQWRPDAAGTTFARFAINTVAGVGGMFDVATGQGYAR